MSRTLVVTNDFPTRRGGIESFVFALCERLPASDVVVYTASMPGDRKFDAGLPFPVIRDSSGTLLPTPRVSRNVRLALQAEGCDSVLFGAAASLGLLAPALRAAGARRIVGLTHGHETWWARVPGARRALRRIGDGCDVLTYVSEWCRDVIASALSPAAAARMQRLAPGVDIDAFRPGLDGTAVRSRLGIPLDAPVLLCVGRMVPRKGQDTLIRALPRILAVLPQTRLLLVGDGPYRRDLEKLARSAGVARSVVFAGAVSWEDAPAYFAAGNVFAGPSRTRLGGLEPEALGIVFLEAQACGLPVLVGDSGGAPETVRHGETGYVVDPYNPVAVAAKAIDLLTDRTLARSMGDKGRTWVEQDWTWESSAAQLRRVLES